MRNKQVEAHGQANSHASEIRCGERFEFGENWARFLDLLDDYRIEEAQKSLSQMLCADTLAGMSFIDIGSGSGLFSLAARRLGASVTSFDFDPKSVACTSELRKRYFPDDASWSVFEGSVLDKTLVQSLGHFDIVYSWGVLHHTGRMWEALDTAGTIVRDGGLLFIAIYNDQGSASARWRKLKHFYCRAPSIIKRLLEALVCIHGWWKPWLIDLFAGDPTRTWRSYGKGGRGMSAWRDVVDWIGGYPFEVAKPGDIFEFFKQRGFTLVKLVTTNSLGCNQFVFVKTTVPA